MPAACAALTAPAIIWSPLETITFRSGCAERMSCVALSAGAARYPPAAVATTLMFECDLMIDIRPSWRDFSSGSVGRPGSQSTLHGLIPAQPFTTSLPSSWPFPKNPMPAKIVWPGICTLVLPMLGPHGTSEQPTLTPALSACLIVGVSGPPSFGPMYQASYFLETR